MEELTWAGLDWIFATGPRDFDLIRYDTIRYNTVMTGVLSIVRHVEVSSSLPSLPLPFLSPFLSSPTMSLPW